MTDRELMQQALEALATAEAALADIGDADREPGDDVAWCEARAAQALAAPRKAITALRERLAHCDRCGKKLGGEGHIHTCSPQVQDLMPLFDDWNKDWQK